MPLRRLTYRALDYDTSHLALEIISSKTCTCINVYTDGACMGINVTTSAKGSKNCRKIIRVLSVRRPYMNPLPVAHGHHPRSAALAVAPYVGAAAAVVAPFAPACCLAPPPPRLNHPRPVTFCFCAECGVITSPGAKPAPGLYSDRTAGSCVTPRSWPGDAESTG